MRYPGETAHGTRLSEPELGLLPPWLSVASVLLLLIPHCCSRGSLNCLQVLTVMTVPCMVVAELLSAAPPDKRSIVRRKDLPCGGSPIKEDLVYPYPLTHEVFRGPLCSSDRCHKFSWGQSLD